MRSTKKSSLDNEYIYYDMLINSQGESRIANYSVELTSDLLSRSSDYKMAVHSISMQCSDIPLLIFVPNSYSVTLNYNNSTSNQTFVQYESTSDLATTDSRYYYIYTFSIFLDMINTALQTAFTNLSSKPPTIDTVIPSPPYFTFDPSTGIIALNAQKAYYDTKLLSTPIQIFMNDNLLTYFEGIAIKYYNTPTVVGQNGQFLVYDKYNNSSAIDNTYYSMYADYDPKVLWNSFKTLLFSSSSMSVNSEYYPNQQNDQSGSVRLNGIKIISKYDYNYVGNYISRPLSLEYQPNFYKWISLLDTADFNVVDIKVQWVDEYNNVHDIVLYGTETIAITLAFKRNK